MTKNIGIRNAEPLYFSMDKKYHIIIFSERFGGSVYYTWCVEVVREHVVFDEAFLLTSSGWKLEQHTHTFEESRVLKWL